MPPFLTREVKFTTRIRRCGVSVSRPLGLVLGGGGQKGRGYVQDDVRGYVGDVGRDTMRRYEIPSPCVLDWLGTKINTHWGTITHIAGGNNYQTTWPLGAAWGTGHFDFPKSQVMGMKYGVGFGSSYDHVVCCFVMISCSISTEKIS